MRVTGVMFQVEGTGLLWGPADRDLASALDAAALRQQAIAHNLANAETPMYRRFDVVFEEELARQQQEASRRKIPLRRTHPAHLSSGPLGAVRPAVVRDVSTTMRNDGNNVDVEREMAALARNTLFYQTLTRVVGARLMALRTAISEGRR